MKKKNKYNFKLLKIYRINRKVVGEVDNNNNKDDFITGQ